MVLDDDHLEGGDFDSIDTDKVGVGYAQYPTDLRSELTRRVGPNNSYWMILVP